ncbi:MAG: DUF2207 domain-containing protein [Proteobacteria bacterium]|nr:DUF2207 domain-containing protein [Pseudomonadota bacterium]
MRRLLEIITAAVIGLLLAWAPIVPDALAGSHEEILSFKSQININPNSTITVTETITVRASGNEIKRGIYRDFPTDYKDRFGNTIRVAFRIEGATRNGDSVPYWVESRSGGKRVYMGKKNVFIKPGIYDFILTYTTDRQIGFFKDFDEIYWNATGNDWSFPIKTAEVTVLIPAKAHVVQKSAYTGRRGEKGQDFTSAVDAKGVVWFQTTRTLKPGEGLTVAVAWPKGFVTEPTKSEKAARVVHDNASIIVGVVGLLVILAYYLFAWNRVGRDPEAGTIVPLFEPPDGFSPAAVNYLTHLKFKDTAFAAAVLSMAVKGHLKIDENDGEFTLVKTSDDDTSLSSGGKNLSRNLFRYHPSIVVKQENHKTLGGAKDAFKAKLEGELEKIYFLTNKLYLIPGTILTFLVVIVVAVMAGNDEEGEAIVFISMWLTGWTFGVFAVVKVALTQWRLVLRSGQWSKIGSALIMSLISVPFVSGEFIGIFLLFEETSVVTALLLISIFTMLPLFYHLLKAPTLKGRRVLDQIEGFKLYLSVAEKDRLAALHPPDETPELFERFLPYALALNVEHLWSDHFSGILTGAGKDFQPTWYSGSSWHSHGMSSLGKDLGGSLTSALGSSSSAPGRGGGGSSGGGGGGGGGGGF